MQSRAQGININVALSHEIQSSGDKTSNLNEEDQKENKFGYMKEADLEEINSESSSGEDTVPDEYKETKKGDLEKS